MMNKVIPLLLISIFISSSLTAKLPISATAPNWTLNDIDGNEYTLYDYLDQGYTVILDFSTTWCQPCWDYTTSGALEELYIEHGPLGLPNVSENTTDKVMVFFIEGDAQTTLDDLNGIGSSTVGDFVSATPFPIIDDASLNESYEIFSWPTVYTICPNKKIISNSRAPAFWLLGYIDNCPSHDIDMQLTSLNSNHSFCGDDYTPIVEIQNRSFENILTTATIKTFQEGIELSSYDWTGSLSSLEREDVELLTILNIDSSLPLDFEVIVEGDEVPDNDKISEMLDLGILETSNSVTLKLKTDDYPEETTWEIVNYDGALIESGGPYEAAGTYTHVIPLPEAGCFTFYLYDSNGDGMVNSTTTFGGYELFDNENNSMIVGYGWFDHQTNEVFNVDVVNSLEDKIRNEGVKVYPNPSSGFVSIDLNLFVPSDDVMVEVVDVLGRDVVNNLIDRIDYEYNKINLNLGDLANGIYLISIIHENKRIVQKLQIQK